MTKRRRYRSDILAAMHETMAGMYKAGVIDAHKMREFDAMCLQKGKRPRKGPQRAGVAKRSRADQTP